MLKVLKWLTWAPHVDVRRGWVTRDNRRQVFHKMKLMIRREDEESRVGMMITAAGRPPTSGDEGQRHQGRGSGVLPKGGLFPGPQ